MSVLARRAEQAKLAHLVGENLDLALDAMELRQLRETISARLFDDAKPALQRVATGSRLLPTALTAKVGERVFGATLCAQIAGLLAVPYALDLALRMSDPFLASVSAAIDPRSAGEVVKRIPADRIVAVAHQLLARSEYVTLARFVDYLSRETINAVIESIPDELDLLRIGAYVESHEKLRELVGQLPMPRTRKMIAALTGARAEHWLEALTIAEALDDHWRRILADLAVEAGVVPALVAIAERHDMWSSAIPFVRAMSEEARELALSRLSPEQRAKLQ
ncbi:MAG TPA: hypothetical protein VGC41_10385 [Kofleriaceae bacterium]